MEARFFIVSAANLALSILVTYTVVRYLRKRYARMWRNYASRDRSLPVPSTWWPRGFANPLDPARLAVFVLFASTASFFGVLVYPLSSPTIEPLTGPGAIRSAVTLVLSVGSIFLSLKAWIVTLVAHDLRVAGKPTGKPHIWLLSGAVCILFLTQIIVRLMSSN
jgi:hypothetical protein